MEKKHIPIKLGKKQGYIPIKAKWENIEIICADENCSSRNRPKSIDIKNNLLLIGTSFKCPYCRGYKFIICKKK